MTGPAVTTVEVGLGARSYPIHIGSGLLNRGDLVAPALAGDDVLVVSDENVAPLYLEQFRATLTDRRVETVVVMVDGAPTDPRDPGGTSVTVREMVGVVDGSSVASGGDPGRHDAEVKEYFELSQRSRTGWIDVQK